MKTDDLHVPLMDHPVCMYSREGENVTIQMMMEAENLGNTTTYNVVGEIPGTEFPDQVIPVLKT